MHIRQPTRPTLDCAGGGTSRREFVKSGAAPLMAGAVQTGRGQGLVMRSTFTLQRALVNERILAGEQKVPPLVTCREVLEMATIQGARDCHLDSKIGTLTPGKEADIILLRTDTINVMPLNHAAGAIVTLMDTSNVDTVLIAGTVVKRGGRLVGVDLPKLRQAVEASRDAVMARAGYKLDRVGLRT